MADLQATPAPGPKLELLHMHSALALVLALLEAVDLSFTFAGVVATVQPLIFQGLSGVVVGGQSALDVLFVHDFIQVTISQVDVVVLLIAAFQVLGLLGLVGVTGLYSWT